MNNTFPSKKLIDTVWVCPDNQAVEYARNFVYENICGLFATLGIGMFYGLKDDMPLTQNKEFKKEVQDCIFSRMDFVELVRLPFLDQLYIDLVTQAAKIESEFCVLEIKEGELYLQYKSQLKSKLEKTATIPRERCTVSTL